MKSSKSTHIYIKFTMLGKLQLPINNIKHMIKKGKIRSPREHPNLSKGQ